LAIQKLLAVVEELLRLSGSASPGPILVDGGEGSEYDGGEGSEWRAEVRWTRSVELVGDSNFFGGRDREVKTEKRVHSHDPSIQSHRGK
jgi:hypothetical protein